MDQRITECRVLHCAKSKEGMVPDSVFCSMLKSRINGPKRKVDKLPRMKLNERSTITKVVSREYESGTDPDRNVFALRMFANFLGNSGREPESLSAQTLQHAVNLISS